MILTRGKIVIIAIAVAIVIGLAGLVQLTVIESEELGPQVTIALEDVKMKEVDKETNLMIIVVDFAVINSADKTLTISRADYELFANERSLGRGFMSLADIPLAGRPQIFPDSSTTIPTEFRLKYSEDVKDLWDILEVGDEEEDSQISWRVEGSADIETAFSIIPIDFESSI